MPRPTTAAADEDHFLDARRDARRDGEDAGDLAGAVRRRVARRSDGHAVEGDGGQNLADREIIDLEGDDILLERRPRRHETGGLGRVGLDDVPRAAEGGVGVVAGQAARCPPAPQIAHQARAARLERLDDDGPAVDPGFQLDDRRDGRDREGVVGVDHQRAGAGGLADHRARRRHQRRGHTRKAAVALRGGHVDRERQDAVDDRAGLRLPCIAQVVVEERVGQQALDDAGRAGVGGRLETLLGDQPEDVVDARVEPRNVLHRHDLHAVVADRTHRAPRLADSGEAQHVRRDERRARVVIGRHTLEPDQLAGLVEADAIEARQLLVVGHEDQRPRDRTGHEKPSSVEESAVTVATY
jgi:hypothetical protein